MAHYLGYRSNNRLTGVK